MPPPPTRWMPLAMRSCASSGGVRARHAITASQIARTCSSIAARTSSGTSIDRLRQAAHEVAAAHLGLPLVVDRERRADRELDLLGGALADRDAVLAAHVAWIAASMSKRPDAHGFERDDAAERDHRDLGGAAADVDDHVAERLVDRQRRADRRGHRLLDAGSVCDAPGHAAPPRAPRAARRAVIADGTQISTRARWRRCTPTRWNSSRISRCVISKSVIAPPRSGRTATM